MRNIAKIIMYCVIISLPSKHIAQDEVGNFEFDGQNRQYEVYLPKTFTSNMPLVLALHGYDETIEWFSDYTLLHNFADTSGFIVVYPKAISTCWNTGAVDERRDFPDVNDVGFISALIDVLIDKYELDRSRIYCCGFSTGGEMSFRLICELGHRFAAVASVSGLLFDKAYNWKPIRPFPILQMHGTGFERWYPYEGEGKGDIWSVSKTLDYWIQKNNCSPLADTVSLPDTCDTDSSNVELITYKTCSGNVEIFHYKIINGGHSWPRATYTNELLGVRNMDIYANEHILNFFNDFTNPLVNLAFGNTLKCSNKFYSISNNDGIVIKATIFNPEDHQISVSATIENSKSLVADSLKLYDDGLHNDENSSDGIYGSQLLASVFEEDFYKIKLYTTDYDESITTACPRNEYFTTAGPIEFETTDVDMLSNGRIALKNFTLINNGLLKTVENIEAELATVDTNVEFTISTKYFGDIAAGGSKTIPAAYAFFAANDAQIIEFEIKIKSNDKEYWTDTLILDVVNLTDIDYDPTTIREEFSLGQNYPNPFNPSTTIKYSIPKQSNVTLKVFDVLGSEVETLVQKIQAQGNYEVEFDGSELTSGIYFYRLKAGDFVETKRMILLK